MSDLDLITATDYMYHLRLFPTHLSLHLFHMQINRFPNELGPSELMSSASHGLD